MWENHLKMVQIIIYFSEFKEKAFLNQNLIKKDIGHTWVGCLIENNWYLVDPTL